MTDLRGRSAIITGGGRGTGAAIARALSHAGASVLVAARSEDQVERVARELTAAGRRASAVTCDITDAGSVDALMQRATRVLGRVDVLVNNAGMAFASALPKTSVDDWDRLFAVNVRGTFLCTRAFLPGMVERRWGRVVNIASTAAIRGERYISAYAASKHAVMGFTRSVAAEVADAGITVNAVCPGYLDTEMTRDSIDRIVERTGRSPSDALAAILAMNPQRRLIAPDEVAAIVSFLCGDEASGINGEAIIVDGGELRR
ncbi:MAG: SDR family NAD(P)-dependent oxidoreductase [Vicinamibacterales bacterium]